MDTHGNESPPALLSPDDTVDVPAAPRVHELALGVPSPNPLRGDGLVRLALPFAGRVRLEVRDAAGRKVATLADGAFESGEHALPLGGRAQALEPGLYFLRLEAQGRTLTRRLSCPREVRPG